METVLGTRSSAIILVSAVVVDIVGLHFEYLPVSSTATQHFTNAARKEMTQIDNNGTNVQEGNQKVEEAKVVVSKSRGFALAD